MRHTTKKAGFYDPYLDVLGGGERYLLSIAKALGEYGYQPFVFWDADLNNDIENRFHLNLPSVSYLPDITRLNILQRINILKSLDLFFYITDGSYTFSSAKKNFVYAMIPQKSLYNLSVMDKLKLNNTIFITHSLFNQRMMKRWGTRSETLYPYITIPSSLGRNPKKQPVILSVGRFFGHLHSKQQERIIEWYRELRDANVDFKEYKLVLAGGLKTEDDQEFFNSLKKKIGRDPSIELKSNVSYAELSRLYQEARFFWHFTGLGYDENEHPENVEHLGITPLEAMASGCIVFCYSAGGPKELIEDGATGFLFLTKEELFKKMENALMDKKGILPKKAQSYIRTKLSYSQFKNRIKELFL